MYWVTKLVSQPVSLYAVALLVSTQLLQSEALERTITSIAQSQSSVVISTVQHSVCPAIFTTSLFNAWGSNEYELL